MDSCKASPTLTSERKQLIERFSKQEVRISNGIETYRKGSAQLRFYDESGTPATGLKYSLKLKRHHFLFGANTFMLDGYGTEKENHTYERTFAKVFNSAVVPFFWSDLEPEQGQLRFKVNSPKIFRRPPPDLVLEFCARNNLTPKGHCLAWHQFLPDWLPTERSEVMPLICKRIDEIAREYGDRINLWDVVNEPMEKFMSPNKDRLPEDYVFKSFERASEVFPPSTQLILNEATAFSWREFHEETTGLDLLARNLLLRGTKLGALGMQYHYFFYDEKGMLFDAESLRKHGQHLLDPARLLRVLDAFAKLGLPLHVSEITLPAYADIEDGEELQAQLAEALYRVWFSHPQVGGIYWWNLADGHAHGEEGRLKAGLLREDLSPKPAYNALERLINEEWSTHLSGFVQKEKSFRGFYGEYILEVEFAGEMESHTFQLLPGGPSQIDIRLGKRQTSNQF